MSRHTLTDEQGRDVVVGWDPPLVTYFAQSDWDEEDRAHFWIGMKPGEFYDLPEFKAALADRGIELPSELEATLYLDRDLGR